ncbi:MAG TPA: tyrosine/phenylalanine carboxypeptidase domain-containing protein, partial [Polyangiaceae bacterium]|nr:tyrosine/phenylalanine carboxypeptidase domain-containing protein [Polyangiaceae bacterium]
MCPRSAPSPETEKLVERATAAFEGAAALLDAITWPRKVERAFFDSGCDALPAPEYAIDRDAVQARLARLDALETELGGDDALSRFLRLRAHSHRLGARMLLAVGTKEFGTLSREAFGGARTSWLDRDTTNLDFAEDLAKSLGEGARPDGDAERLDAAGLARYLEERLSKKRRAPTVTIAVDDELGAKAIAGKKRVRIRSDATFDAEEARSLYLHEIETHVFTAQNGDEQPHLKFMDSGGPCATKTQEGLAVFSELYSQALTSDRLRRLVTRVRLVALAEDGANFLDLYRWLVARGVEPRAAYLDAARVARGGVVSGGSPFTKDASYLAGLVDVYDFLRLAVSRGRQAVVETLASGRL